MSTGFPNPPEYKGVYVCNLNIININENDINTLGIDQILRNLGRNPDSGNDVYLMVSNSTRSQVISNGNYTVDNYANDTCLLIPNRLRSNNGTPFPEDWGQVTRALLSTGDPVVTGSVLRFKFKGTDINFCGFNHFNNYVKVTDFTLTHRSGQLTTPPAGSVVLPKNRFLSYMQYEYDIPTVVDESRISAIVQTSRRTSIPVEMEVYISYSMPLLKDYLTVSQLPGGITPSLGELTNTNLLVDTGASLGDILTWTGAEWIHQPPPFGEANTSSNLGTGEGLASTKVGVDLPFKSLIGGTNVGLVADADTITINATDTGEANTSSNLGTGEGLASTKVGDDLPFKSLIGGTNVDLVADADTITINATDTGEVNTSSNLGAGEGLASTKVGTNLPFKSLIGGTNVGLVADADTITINATDTGEANTGSNLGGGAEVFKQKTGVDLVHRTIIDTGNITATQLTDTIELKIEGETGLVWQFDSTVDGTPASGFFTMETNSLGSATYLKINGVQKDGSFVSGLFGNFLKAGDRIFIYESSNKGNWTRLEITNITITSFIQLDFTLVDGALGGFSNTSTYTFFHSPNDTAVSAHTIGFHSNVNPTADDPIASDGKYLSYGKFGWGPSGVSYTSLGNKIGLAGHRYKYTENVFNFGLQGHFYVATGLIPGVTSLISVSTQSYFMEQNLVDISNLGPAIIPKDTLMFAFWEAPNASDNWFFYGRNTTDLTLDGVSPNDYWTGQWNIIAAQGEITGATDITLFIVPPGPNPIGGDGIDITGDTVTADLKVDGGLVIEGGKIAVDFGATSITGAPLPVTSGGTNNTALDGILRGIDGTTPYADISTVFTPDVRYDPSGISGTVGNVNWIPSIGTVPLPVQDQGTLTTISTIAGKPSVDLPLNNGWITLDTNLVTTDSDDWTVVLLANNFTLNSNSVYADFMVNPNDPLGNPPNISFMQEGGPGGTFRTYFAGAPTNPSGSAQLFWSPVLNGSLVNATPFVFVFRSSANNTFRVWANSLNDVLYVNDGIYNTVGDNWRYMRFGGDPAQIWKTGINVSEFMFWKSALTDAQVTDLSASLLEEYSVRTATPPQVVALKSVFESNSAPTQNTDSTLGYTIGSRWLDTTTEKEYVCLDATVGAAIWKETTINAIDLQTAMGHRYTYTGLSTTNTDEFGINGNTLTLGTSSQGYSITNLIDPNTTFIAYNATGNGKYVALKITKHCDNWY
jgi:hypothetical protein